MKIGRWDLCTALALRRSWKRYDPNWAVVDKVGAGEIGADKQDGDPGISQGGGDFRFPF
jgi:hypothetical protein